MKFNSKHLILAVMSSLNSEASKEKNTMSNYGKSCNTIREYCRKYENEGVNWNGKYSECIQKNNQARIEAHHCEE